MTMMSARVVNEAASPEKLHERNLEDKKKIHAAIPSPRTRSLRHRLPDRSQYVSG